MAEKDFYSDDDIITMVSKDGKEVDFVELADLMYEGKYYLVAEPCEPFEGQEETFPMVFLVTEKGEDAELTVELNDDIVDAVLAKYEKLLDEAEEDTEEDNDNK